MMGPIAKYPMLTMAFKGCRSTVQTDVERKRASGHRLRSTLLRHLVSIISESEFIDVLPAILVPNAHSRGLAPKKSRSFPEFFRGDSHE